MCTFTYLYTIDLFDAPKDQTEPTDTGKLYTPIATGAVGYKSIALRLNTVALQYLGSIFLKKMHV